MKHTRERPIEIVGGGLAGLSLGLALRREGVRVTLHEASTYPRHRVCGEFITGLTAATRDRLGLGEFLADAKLHREVAWYHRAAPVLRHGLPEAALGLSRHALDQRLANAFVREGGELRVGSRVEAKSAPPGRVFALGRRAATGSRWLGLKCHARGLRLAAALEVHLGEQAYVGLCEVEGGWINVSGLFRVRPELAVKRATALPLYLRAAGLEALADRLETAEIEADSRCAVAGLAFGRVNATAGEARAGAERLEIGDAHALIPPFTGHGMAMAFEAAAIAVDPLLAWARGAGDWREVVEHVTQLLRARFRTRLATSAMLHPVLLRPAAQGALAMLARSGLLPTTPLYRLLHG